MYRRERSCRVSFRRLVLRRAAWTSRSPRSYSQTILLFRLRAKSSQPLTTSVRPTKQTNLPSPLLPLTPHPSSLPFPQPLSTPHPPPSHPSPRATSPVQIPNFLPFTRSGAWYSVCLVQTRLHDCTGDSRPYLQPRLASTQRTAFLHEPSHTKAAFLHEPSRTKTAFLHELLTRAGCRATKRAAVARFARLANVADAGVGCGPEEGKGGAAVLARA